jgi:NADH-quinone oxidoreductase subunit M
MGGYAKAAPKFATLFMILLLGSMGVPLTNGFIGEFILLKSIFDYDKVVVVFAGLTIILAAVYLLRMYGKTMFGTGDERVVNTLKDISNVEFVVLASLAVVVIVLGVFPSGVLEMVNSSLKFIYSSIKG